MRVRIRVLSAITTAALATVMSVATATPAHATTSVWFQFQKQSATFSASSPNATLTLYYSNDPTYPPHYVASWPAGSGTSSDTCYSYHGWLPDGTYSIKAWYPNHTGTVEGPAIYLSDKACYNGTLRTELFIHSSYPWGTGRYTSNGCIKLSNTGGPSPASGNIQDAYNRGQAYGATQVKVYG